MKRSAKSMHIRRNRRNLMKIREVRAPDFISITNLYYHLYPSRNKTPLIKITNPKSKSNILIASQGKDVVGFILVTFTSYGKSKYGYIEELVVDKNHRGRGIGKGLTKKALAWEKKLGAEVVFVTTDRATDFYKKIGFRALKTNTYLLWTPK